MAKNKHQKLADLMEQRLYDLNEHKHRVAKTLNFVFLGFYETNKLMGRPGTPISVFQSMCSTHYLGLQSFAPDPLMREIYQKYPALAGFLYRPLYLRSECRQSRGNIRWAIPWGTKVELPEGHKVRFERNMAQALLYCPAYDEISNRIDWFAEEMSNDSLTHQILSNGERERHMTTIRYNLLKDPFPICEKAKKEWYASLKGEADCDVMNDDIAINPQSINGVDFIPQEGDLLGLAYERVLQSKENRCFRHRRGLRELYKQFLEEELFENVPWTKAEKVAYLRNEHASLFKNRPLKKTRKYGRWLQCEGIDDITASRFIKYFVTSFIEDPKNKKMGEIACVLWIFLCISQEGKGSNISIKQVLQLTSKDIVSDDVAIHINGVDNGINIPISCGLRDLLLCLRGKGEGERGHRLFKNLDLSGKTLERALIKASKKLLPEGSMPVLPGAFLIFPHTHPGIRISAEERMAIRNLKPIVPLQYGMKDVRKTLVRSKETLKRV